MWPSQLAEALHFLHCKCDASNLILEILKHNKICGTIFISMPQILWNESPVAP